jgi:hypothetical protein
MDDGTYLRTRGQQRDSSEDSSEPEVGRDPPLSPPPPRREEIAEKVEPRAIYGLLVNILQTFHLSTLGEMDRMKDKLVQNSAKLSDLGDSAKGMKNT